MADDDTPESGPASRMAGGPEYESYCLALGRFVSAFSAVENIVQALFWRLTGVEERLAPTVFSGVRMDAAQSLIGRILDAKPCQGLDRDELDEVFAQLTAITRVRNDILHYGADRRAAGEFVTSNEHLAFTPCRLRETRVSPDVLDALHADLAKIAIQLAGIFGAAHGMEELQARLWRCATRRGGSHGGINEAGHLVIASRAPPLLQGNDARADHLGGGLVGVTFLIRIIAACCFLRVTIA